MHVLVGCNIENENNGCLGAPQTDPFFAILRFESGAAKRQNKQTNKQVMEDVGFVLKLLQFLFSYYYCYFFFICAWVHFKVFVLCNNNRWMLAWAYIEKSKWQHFLEEMWPLNPPPPRKCFIRPPVYFLYSYTVKVCASNRHSVFC